MTSRNGIPAVDVLGIHVGVLTPERLLDEVSSIVEAEDHAYVTFTGVHGVMESQRDPDLVAIHNDAAIVCPDGMPLVWAGRRAHVDGGSRCYGPDCMLALCDLAAGRSWPIFLYGGKPGVAEKLAGNLVERYPQLEVAGTHSPPFGDLTDDERRAETQLIDDSGARLVFVGLSTPKQERWMSANVGQLKANVLFGVGAAFDFHTGLVRQAPRWMQRSGLEWAHRMLAEPRRLAKRYFVNNPAYIRRILAHPPRPVGVDNGPGSRSSIHQ